MEHTPGPWRAKDRHEGLDWIIRGPDGVYVAEVIGPSTPSLDRYEADARLIAAAPALYRVVRLALTSLGCRHHAGSNSAGCCHCSLYQDARAALALATAPEDTHGA